MTHWTVTGTQGATYLMAAIVAETAEEARDQFRARYPLARGIRVRPYRRRRAA